MQRIATLTAITLLLTSGAAWAGCDYPDEPITPDASQATIEDMQAAIAGFKEFSKALEEYRQCLEDDLNSLDKETRSEEREALFVKRHDSSVDREKQLADLLNEQIRVWQKANQKSE